MIDQFISSPEKLGGILSLVTLGLSLYLNNKKAGKSVVSDLIDKVVALQETDAKHRQELNLKEIQIQQLKFKNQGMEQRMADQWKILTGRDPHQEKAMGLLVEGMSTLLAKFENVEVVQDEQIPKS